jgi:hypothetical protein
MAPTADPGLDRFRYNLLAARINELGAIWSAAYRADREFRSTRRVREELQQAATYPTVRHGLCQMGRRNRRSRPRTVA